MVATNALAVNEQCMHALPQLGTDSTTIHADPSLSTRSQPSPGYFVWNPSRLRMHNTTQDIKDHQFQRQLVEVVEGFATNMEAISEVDGLLD